MTRLLVSVTSAEEALAALGAGATYIDAKDPAQGALGALPAATTATIVEAVAGRAEVTAALGDTLSLPDARAIAATGVAYVKAAVPAGPDAADVIATVGRELADAGSRLIAVFPAGPDLDLALVETAAAAGFAGVMLDTTDKSVTLLTAMEMADIARFVAAARRSRLMVGLAGSLRVVDVGTLLPMQPDVIGFRGGVCEGRDRRNPVDPARVRAVATAITVHGARRMVVE